MSVASEFLNDPELSVYHIRLMVGYTAMMYDHVLTFADEIQYIWKAEKSPVTVMFLLNRYVTPIVLGIDLYDKGGISSYTSDRFCITWYYAEAAWYLCSFGITHALVAMRVAAIWGRPRWIIILLVSLWLVYFSATCTILFSAMTSKADTVHYEPLLKLCYLSISPYLWACWIPPLVLEVVLFTLSCVQAARAGRYAKQTPILFVLFRDGALHFTVIVFCSLFNMITWVVAPPSLVALAKYFGLAIVNVMISRLVLNLRSCQKSSIYVSSVKFHPDDVEMELSPSKAHFMQA